MSPTYTIAHSECSLGWGGQEIRVFTEMLAMRARGHRLLLFAPVESVIYGKAASAGLAVHPMTDAKPAYPLTITRLALALRKERVRIVNTHSSSDGWIAGLAARLAGIPMLIRSRHIEVEYPSRFLSRVAFHRLPHHVLTTSRRISARLIQNLGLSPEKVTCLPTGIDLEKFHPGVQGRLREELNLDTSVPLVGMVSVLRSWKGHPYFLEAAAEILRQKRRVHFVIAGDGPGRVWLEGRLEQPDLKSHVTWLGHREDVPNILASLDLLVLPSTGHEGIPQIILQAQAMGKAVVGTTVGGIPEVVSHQQTGWLVPPMESKPLAQSILLLLDNPALRKRLGEQASAQVAREHGLDKMCERLEALYAGYLTPR